MYTDVSILGPILPVKTQDRGVYIIKFSLNLFMQIKPWV